jgi:4-aminobutyrate aminotransferase-like enzyme
MSGKLPACISADYPYSVEITANKKKKEISRVALAEQLIKITSKVMPFSKKRVYFEVSGATAVNVALKIAKITVLRKRGVKTENLKDFFEKDIFIPSQEELCKFSFLVFRNAFHGRHGDVQCLTNSKVKQLWAASSSCAFGRLPFPAPFFGYDDYKPYWANIDKTIEKLSKFAPIIAFVFEPIQGEGGINVPDSDFLRGLIGHLKSNIREIYLIADEVQTGFGRTGKMFACEHFGIHPDMMVLSKSLGAGLAIGAVVVNDEKFPDLEPGMHSGSHLADPMAVAAAIANIDMIIEQNLVDRSSCYGVYAIKRLKEIAKKFPRTIADIRGLGLMIGIEFFSANFRDEVVKECFREGLLLAPAGAKVIRMTPPLVVSIPEIDKALDIFENALKTPS